MMTFRPALRTVCAALIFTTVSAAALAQITDSFKSETGLFSAVFSGTPEVTELSRMRLDDQTVIYSTEVKYEENVMPAGPGKKYFLIRADQSFNTPFTEKELKGAVETEVAEYKTHYAEPQFKIKTADDIQNGPYAGKDFFIETGKTGLDDLSIRSHVFINGRTRAQIVAIAPNHLIESHTIEAYINSLKLPEMESATPGSIIEDWVKHPLDEGDLFSIRIPPAAPPYLMKDPVIESMGSQRAIRATFNDPVKHKKLKFAAFLYSFGTESITRDVFKTYVTRYHIPDTESLRSTQIDMGAFNGEQMWSSIPDSDDPTQSEKIVKAYYINKYYGNTYVLVTEVSGDSDSTQTPFAENLLNSLVIKNMVGGEPMDVEQEPAAADAPERLPDN